jgi:phage tail-like protein
MTSRPLNSDPLRNFRFRVGINHPDIPNLVNLGFMAVSGLSVNNEVIPYREGGNNTTTRKMPGQSDFGPISCTRGMMAAPVMASGSAGSSAGSNEIYTWFTEIFSVNVGGGFGNGIRNFRVGVTIDVLEHPITQGGYAAGVDNPPPIKARFQVYNAWPMGLSYSDLEAGGNAVIIENLTLAHEGWQLLTASTAPGNYLGASRQI